MSFEVKSITVFERQAKRLLKKYPPLKNELLALIQELKELPDQGTEILLDPCFCTPGWIFIKHAKNWQAYVSK